MSRKSRQKKGRTLLKKAFPTWLALPMLIVSILLGAIACLSPWISQPIPLEDTAAVSATFEKAEASYSRHHLHAIHLNFSDHERLTISSKISHKALLEKLKTYPAGTVFDMLLDGSDILALSAGEEKILTYKAACKAIAFNNQFAIPIVIFSFCMAAYAAWSLFIHWKYRRLT